MDFIRQLETFCPEGAEESADHSLILRCLRQEEDVFTRQNPLVHLTASAWVVNPDRTKLLLCYHKLYDSWAWLGGHADGDRDLLQTAIREVREESGLSSVRPLSDQIFSVESLHVMGHYKRGEYVSSHIHLNATYLLEASDQEPLRIKEDENTALCWFSLDEALTVPSEKWMVEHVYKKLNLKLRRFLSHS